MAEPEVPLEEAFRPPLAEPGVERDPSALPGASIVRLHLVALLVALAIHGFVTLVLQVKLLEPGPTLGDELTVRAMVGAHALS